MTNYIQCTRCNGKGGKFSTEGRWRDCPACAGTGLVKLGSGIQEEPRVITEQELREMHNLLMVSVEEICDDFEKRVSIKEGSVL